MPEWWTYSLSDFLLFSPRAYYRLFERYNSAIWPAQILTLGLGLVIATLLRRPGQSTARLISAAGAVIWIWVGWGFVYQRYATINWAATYLLPLFVVEGLLFLWLGVIRDRVCYRLSSNPAAVTGAVLFALSLLLYPALAPLGGRDWQQAEVFGLAPDPTALGTLGLLLTTEGVPHWTLLVIPVFWCTLSGLTLYALSSREWWILLAAAFIAVVLSLWSQRNRGRSVTALETRFSR